MARPLRIEYPGALYHITSRGNEKKAIYLDSHDRDKFLSIVEDYHERYGILIHSYVLSQKSRPDTILPRILERKRHEST